MLALLNGFQVDGEGAGKKHPERKSLGSILKFSRYLI